MRLPKGKEFRTPLLKITSRHVFKLHRTNVFERSPSPKTSYLRRHFEGRPCVFSSNGLDLFRRRWFVESPKQGSSVN
ncbi:hypothetical protein CEXT_135761 [Caerostris extrusa]|uniref:Uncharacterized protein n=1 Tax=Caerostris extrusa TaxID=172846 RepID=A0AAV4PYF9_CAEEX|nr:hypothetical protein CEXT_135761 [Caerostris extrusa]